jgi:hypothetical protein
MTKSALSINDISPYGWLNTECSVEFKRGLADFGFGSLVLEAFFTEKIVLPIAMCAWPRWDYKNCKWLQDTSKNSAVSLTLADLDIMQNLHGIPNGSDPLFNTARPSGIAVAHNKLHYDLFGIEDSDARLARILSYYVPYLPPLNLSQVRSVDDIATYIFRTKGLFQRPRPATLGLMLKKEIRVYRAITALHPSLVSGHATQAMFIAIELYLQLMKSTSPSGWQAALQYFAVDMGDRRVFAGVHYPSDNLASWFMLTKLAPYIWPNDYKLVRNFIHGALEHSVVYKATLQSAPHTCLLDLLNTTLANK